jgi:hypothetical protein
MQKNCKKIGKKIVKKSAKKNQKKFRENVFFFFGYRCSTSKLKSACKNLGGGAG